MNIANILIFIALVVGLAAVSTHAQTDVPDNISLLTQANEAFDRGLALRDTDKEKATAQFEAAAAMYTHVTRSGVHNADLLVNLGNAQMLAGNTGNAIVSYRRAEQLSPSSERVRDALESARSQVSLSLPTSSANAVVSSIGSWRRFVPRWIVLWLAAGCWVLVWVAVTAKIAWRRNISGGGVCTLAAVTLLCTGLLVAESYVVSNQHDAVVVTATQALQGPADGVYAPAFSTELTPGVEVSAIQTRNDWTKIRIDNGTTGWVPTRTLKRIDFDAWDA